VSSHCNIRAQKSIIVSDTNLMRETRTQGKGEGTH